MLLHQLRQKFKVILFTLLDELCKIKCDKDDTLNAENTGIQFWVDYVDHYFSHNRWKSCLNNIYQLSYTSEF